MWDLVPLSGIKPRLLHWVHRVLTTELPGKSQVTHLCLITKYLFHEVFFFFLRSIYLIFGCTGSSLLHSGFLKLQQVGATL